MSISIGNSVAPGIVVYENVIDNCQELIDLALSTPEKWRDSKIAGFNNTEGLVDKEFRNTRILDVPANYSNDSRWFFASRAVWQYADKYGKEFGAEFSNMETLQLLNYFTKDGLYKPHIDSGPGMQRIFSAVLYLNDVEEGGETYFNNFNVFVKPKTGRLVIFPANYIYMHEAKTPVSNEKFALVTWFNPAL